MTLNYKVYGLVSKNGIIRYIGITRKSLKERLTGHKKDVNRNRNPHKCNWIKKHCFEINIVLLEDGISTLSAAESRERFYIDKYSKNILLNKTRGGNILPKEKQYSGPSWNKGKKCEYIDKLITNSPRSKKVYCYDLNGRLLCEYRSLKHAQESTGAHRLSIRNCADKKPQHKQAAGYQWRWFKVDFIPPYLKSKRGVEVECLDTGKKYNSIKEVADEFRVKQSKVQRVIKDGFFAINDLNDKKHKRVLCCQNNKIYPSVASAAKDLCISNSGVSDVLRGVRNSVYGYTFKIA